MQYTRNIVSWRTAEEKKRRGKTKMVVPEKIFKLKKEKERERTEGKGTLI